MQFPQTTARLPGGQRIHLPDGLENDLNVLLIAFHGGQRVALTSWVPSVKHMAHAHEGLGYYQIILADGISWLWKTLRSLGMGGLAAEGATILYIAAGELERALDLSGSRDVCAVLVDRDGRIWWVAEGGVTADKVQHLAEAAQRARGTSPVGELDDAIEN